MTVVYSNTEIGYPELNNPEMFHKLFFEWLDYYFNSPQWIENKLVESNMKLLYDHKEGPSEFEIKEIFNFLKLALSVGGAKLYRHRRPYQTGGNEEYVVLIESVK